MSARQNEVIKIHQALHGYSDGHRLLGSSMALPRETERVVLILSDMSGPSMLRGFDSYLTGYPLPDADFYAFARTWYAAEMNRPGCVWTHTLLIENADLARIRDLRVLVRLFRRPQKGQSWSASQSPLVLSISSADEDGANQDRVSASIATVALAALYGSSDKPVYMPADSSERYEDLVLVIWTQQWPRLRRSFRFCTGSLSNRTVNGKAFDVQVVPVASVRQLNREVPNAEFVETETAADSTDLPTWIKAATADLLAKTQGPLRQFLWEFGADLSEGRAAFSRLAEIYTNLESARLRILSLTDLIDAVSRCFPRAMDAARLKVAIFGEMASHDHRLLPKVAESGLLRELVTTEHYAAFDVGALGIRRRAKALWETDREQAKRFTLELVRVDLNPLGEEFLTGISEAIGMAEAVEFQKTKPELLHILVKRNPALAALPELWRGSSDEQRKLLDAVASCQNVTPATLKSIVAAILAAGVDTIADDIVERLGSQAIIAVLEWFDASASISSEELMLGWRRTLASRPSVLLNWLHEAGAPHEATVALVASLLDPHSPEVHRFGTEVWLRFAVTAPAKLDRKTLMKAMAFLLALGFNNPGAGAEELVAQAFEVVHDAAENDELDYDSWQLLKDQVPSLSWWRDWDKCERLRRALVDRFIRYDWPVDQFLRSVKNEETFRRIVDFCRMTPSGRTFLRRVVKLVAQGEVYATDAQRAVLTRAY